MSRRRALATLAAGSLATAFGGCGRAAGAPVTIWHPFAAEPTGRFAQTLIRFMASHPGVAVETNAVHYTQIRKLLEQGIASDSLPDVFVVSSSMVPRIAKRVPLADLGVLARQDGYDLPGRLIPHDRERCQVEGRQLALPLVAASTAHSLMLNLDMLEAAGMPPRDFENQEDLTAWSAELAVRLNPTRSSARAIPFDPFTQSALYLALLACGVDSPTVSDDGSTARLTDPGFVRAVTAADALVHAIMGPGETAYRTLLDWRQHNGQAIENLRITPFLQQRAAAFISNASAPGIILRENPDANISVQPIPGLERKHGGIRSHHWAVAVRGDSPQLEEAWKLARYLALEDAGNGRYCRELMILSPNRQANENRDYGRHNAVWQGILRCAALDMDHRGSLHPEFHAQHIPEIPLYRLRGDSIEKVCAQLNTSYQQYLDSRRSRKS